MFKSNQKAKAPHYNEPQPIKLGKPLPRADIAATRPLASARKFKIDFPSVPPTKKRMES
jgi:hypothetical protein